MKKRPPVKIGELEERVWEIVPFIGNNVRREQALKQSKHAWLRAKYGRPDYCMNSVCDKLCEWFDWALKTGRSYSHDPHDYLWLCRRCHRRYDMTDELREAAMKNLWWKRGLPFPNKEPNIQNLWWQKDKEKTKQLKITKLKQTPRGVE